MTKITMKRGDTFAVYCQRVDASGNPVNLTGVTISATIALLTFTGALTVTVTDAVNGKFTVSATPAATSLWPVTGSQQMFFDVQFDDGTYVVSSDSIQVVVQQSQTQVASTSTGLPGQSGNPLVFQDAPNASGNIGAGANVQTGSVLYKFAASYMGALAADPATRTDGSALQTGDIYWNTTLNEQRTWNGANWQVVYTPSPTTTGDINYTGTLTGGTGVVNIGSGQFYKDAAGNVGVGTTSPSGYGNTGKLTVQSASSTNGVIATFANSGATGAAIQFFQNGVATADIGMPAGDGGIYFKPSGSTERMRIDSAGHVNIGATSFNAGYLLGVYGGIGAVVGAGSASPNSNKGLWVTATNGTSNEGFAWQLGASNEAKLIVGDGSTAWLDRLTVDTKGDVGIGVVPNAWSGGSYRALQVGAITSLVDAGGGYSWFGCNGYVDAGVWKYMTTNPATLYQQGQGSHQWYIAASGTAGASIALSQAMQLDPSGNLLVGTTTYGGIGVSLNPVGGQIINYSGTGTNTMIEFKNSNGTVGYISSSGTATSYNQSSDRRLKTKITDAAEAGSVIDLIKVRSFDWKADGSHQRFGFIAQELVRVAPEAVTMPENPDAIWAVDYSKLVPMLTKEIQSLRRRVASLEAA